MQLQQRSEELCRENDLLHRQLTEMGKELELEKGKVRTKIKELMEERDKNKKLEQQIIGEFEGILFLFVFGDLSWKTSQLLIVFCLQPYQISMRRRWKKHRKEWINRVKQ
eukprot:sb/3477304/